SSPRARRAVGTAAGHGRCVGGCAYRGSGDVLALDGEGRSGGTLLQLVRARRGPTVADAGGRLLSGRSPLGIGAVVRALPRGTVPRGRETRGRLSGPPAGRRHPQKGCGAAPGPLADDRTKRALSIGRRAGFRDGRPSFGRVDDRASVHGGGRQT